MGAFWGGRVIGGRDSREKGGAGGGGEAFGGGFGGDGKGGGCGRC